MQGMTAPIGWNEIALRLAVTIVVGIVIGYDRSEHGKAAGMRTTLIVCLAASVSMIQVNLLLPTAGRPPGSFVMNDLMRFPLGILTGVGFIGGGAILRRESLVIGVTTAATLWLVTVIGLCIGGGQIGLGLAPARHAAGLERARLALIDRFLLLWNIKGTTIATAHRPGRTYTRLIQNRPFENANQASSTEFYRILSNSWPALPPLQTALISKSG
jgi:hypothetical protein